MANKTIDFDPDRYIDDWLARKISVRQIAEITGLKRATVHTRLKQRCKQLGINSRAGEGVGLFGIVQQEYLNPKKLARMRDRDRQAITQWAQENHQAMLEMEGDRLYPAAKCANRTKRDTIGRRDLGEMSSDTAIGTLWTGAIATTEPVDEGLLIVIGDRIAAPLPLFSFSRL